MQDEQLRRLSDGKLLCCLSTCDASKNKGTHDGDGVRRHPEKVPGYFSGGEKAIYGTVGAEHAGFRIGCHATECVDDSSNHRKRDIRSRIQRPRPV